MKHHKNYSIFEKEKIVAAVAILAVILVAGIAIGASLCHADDEMITCWILCKPGSQVNVRRNPNGHSIIEGYLEVGDSVQTDGQTRNGYLRIYGIGEDGGGWVYCGYIVEEEPVEVYERYCCVAKSRVACRRWCNGPRIEGRTGWLHNGSDVQVFWMTSEWAITSRGYIASEWLEVDPE